MTHPTLLQQADAPLGTSIKLHAVQEDRDWATSNQERCLSGSLHDFYDDTTDKLSVVDALPLLDDEVAVDTFEALDFMVQLSAPFRYRHGRLVAILL